MIARRRKEKVRTVLGFDKKKRAVKASASCGSWFTRP